MANILYAECEEYLFFYEYMQGNSFGGLLYEDVVDDGFSLDDSGYIVYVEEVSDSLSFASSLVPSHEPYCRIEDGFYLTTQFGSPVRAFQTALNVIHTCPIVPIEFCYMSIEVLHGVETYYEELSSEVHCVEFSAPINYVLETLYESYAIVLEPYDLTRDVTVSYQLVMNDMANFMHNIVQEYYFNCLADDVVGLFLRSSFGYNMFVHSQWRIDSFARNAIGRVADDYILFDDDKAELNWSGQCIAQDSITAYDSLFVYRGYDFIVDSGIDISAAIDTSYYMVHLVSDDLYAGDSATSPTERYQTVADNLRLACMTVIEACYFESVGSEIIIDEDSGFAKIGFEPITDEVTMTEEV